MNNENKIPNDLGQNNVSNNLNQQNETIEILDETINNNDLVNQDGSSNTIQPVDTLPVNKTFQVNLNNNEPVINQVTTSQPDQTINQTPTTQPEQNINNTNLNNNNNGNNNGNSNSNKNNKTLPLVIILIILLLGILGGTYYYLFQNTKQVVNRVINKTFKTMNDNLIYFNNSMQKLDYKNNAINYVVDLDFDTNIDDLIQYKDIINNIKLSVSSGFDYKNEILEAGIKLKGKKEEINALFQYAKDKGYIKTSLLKDTIYVNLDEAISFDDIKNEIDKLDKNKNMLNDIETAIINGIDENYLIKETVKEKLIDEEIKVNKYIYELNEKSLEKIVKELKKIEEFKDLTLEDITENGTLTIYTNGLLNNLVGIKLEIDKNILTYYNVGEKIKISYEESYDNNKYIINYNKDTKNGNVLNNNEEKATFKILANDDKNFSIKINSNDQTATLKFIKNEKDKLFNINGDIKLESNGQYMQVKMNYSVKESDKLNSISTDNAILPEKINQEELFTNLTNTVEKDEILKKLYDIITVMFLENNNNNNNQYE